MTLAAGGPPTQRAPAAAYAAAGLSLGRHRDCPASAERPAAGSLNDPGVDDDRPTEHLLHDAWPRDSRQSRDVSQQCQPRMRAQINRFGAAPMFTGTACHDVPSGSPRGYQELFASFGCMAVLVTARRSVGQAVCLCIAAFGVNVLNCRIGRALVRRDLDATAAPFDNSIDGRLAHLDLQGLVMPHRLRR